MIRKMLQAALCLILCPLLIAQPVAAETGPQATEPAAPKVVGTLALPASLVSIKGRKIELVAQEPVPIEAAMTGSPFQFVMDKDVVVEGVTVIHAKTPVTGVIAKINRGSYERSRDGYLDLRLSEPGGGGPVKVRLGGIPPEPVYRSARRAGWNGIGSPAAVAVKIALITVAVILVFALLGGDR
jgi:hypothetical protein